MKKATVILLLFLVSIHSFAWSQALIDEIDRTFNESNTAIIQPYFDGIVEISIDDKNTSYSRSQAQMVLNDFFKKNKVKEFTLTNQGSSGNNIYYIGSMRTGSSKYLVYIYAKKNNKENKEYIQELRIQKV